VVGSSSGVMAGCFRTLASSCLAALVFLLLLAAPAAARADSMDACILASDEGQVLRDHGKLISARERFVQCSSAKCPRLVRTDCAGWLADIDTRIPSVVLSATDPDGHDTADVRVALDGAPLASRLEPRAIPVDPGQHRFRFERDGSPPVDETVILREGERRRTVAVRFRAPAETPATPAGPGSSRPSRETLTAAIALGGLTLAGGGLFAYFAATAQSDANHLRATCSPNCNPADVSAVHTKEIVADVALATGLTAAAAGILVVVFGPRDAPAVAAVTVVPGGGAAVLHLRFQ
jgi:hypothetical protein